MLGQMDHGCAAVGAATRPSMHRPFDGEVAPGARYVLEDTAGFPIECPLCGAVDRWRAEADEMRGQTPAFACRHPREVRADGVTYLVAVVHADQVGGALDLASLVPAAA